jgi:hypothetical protein
MRLPTIGWVRALVAPVLAFIATGLDRGYQTDFWHHLARGRAIVEAGALVNDDRFTFTVFGQPLRDANWLTQVGYYRLFQVGGLPLVQLVNSLVLALMLAGVVYLCRRAGRSMKLAAFLSVGVFLALWPTFLIRPQTLSLLLFVVLYGVLTEARHRRRRWLLVVPPVLMALWCNLHGGFAIGLVLVGAFWVGAAVEWWLHGRRGVVILGLCLFACGAATLLNPYGYRVYAYVLTLSTTAARRGIEEWLPPGMGSWVGRAFAVSVAGMLLLLAKALRRRRRRLRARDACLLVCFLPLACGSVRMVAWWMLVAAPVAARLLKTTRSRHTPLRGERPTEQAPPAFRSCLGPTCAVGALLIVAALSAPPLERFNPLFRFVRSPHRTESDLQTVADRLAGRRVFTRLEWGEYLDWSASPAGARVYLDGRIEVYPDAVWDRYAAVTAGRADWQAILEADRADVLLLDQTYHGGLLARVRCSGRWREAMRAGPAVLFVRTAEPLTALGAGALSVGGGAAATYTAQSR